MDALGQRKKTSSVFEPDFRKQPQKVIVHLVQDKNTKEFFS